MEADGELLADLAVVVSHDAMVQRVMGHENVTTTLQLYTRRTEHHDRIIDGLGDLPTPAEGPGGTDDTDDDGPGTAGLPVPTP